MNAHRALALFAGLALLGGLSRAQPAPAASAPLPLRAIEVVTTLTLARVEVNGLKSAELSALAWSPSAKTLFAASDKGRLFAYRLRWDGEQRLTGAEISAATALIDPATGKRMNAEGLAFAPAGNGRAAQLLVAPEKGASAWALAAVSPDLLPPTAQAWPAAIAQALAEPGTKHGVEAIEWHPEHGLMAALQRPVSTTPTLHTIHAADGRRWAFTSAATRADIKAIERIGIERLLVLERVRGGAQDRREFVLREIDLQACATAPCNPPAIALRSAALDGRDNFEGLACIDATTCLLVSDDGSDGAGPTRLVQLRLQRGPP